jgi:hypothetical protein
METEQGDLELVLGDVKLVDGVLLFLAVTAPASLAAV